MTELREATFPGDLAFVQRLFKNYVDSLGIDLAFQNVEQEFATLPGKYSQPRGCILLAFVDGEPAGCVALRPIDSDTCDMKRLYVLPEFRAQKLGRLLALAICEEGRKRGYARICLDTLASMNSAVMLYTSLGFKPIAPYVYNPIGEALYFGLEL